LRGPIALRAMVQRADGFCERLRGLVDAPADDTGSTARIPS